MATVHVDTIDWSAAQDDWLRPKVGGHLALFCIHQVNRVNSRNGCMHDDSTINIVVSITVITLLRWRQLRMYARDGSSSEFSRWHVVSAKLVTPSPSGTVGTGLRPWSRGWPPSNRSPWHHRPFWAGLSLASLAMWPKSAWVPAPAADDLVQHSEWAFA